MQGESRTEADRNAEATADAEAAGSSEGSASPWGSGIAGALEAVLMVVDEPVSSAELAATLEVPQAEVEDALAGLSAEYTAQGRGFELRAVAGGWRFYSRAEFAEIVSRYVLEGQTARLTQAALETLAVIAYRQPVGRSRVAAIRGVNVDSVVKTLVTRGLIEEAGTDPESGAILYQTTSYFLERLGIGSVAELPKLSPHLPGLDELSAMDGLY
ncbi:segregation and condensation protein B [Sinomonas cellulolyticus]|uniref:SMC-Scp complex subunit ScpB n=1 Tax=Sinomonas cellulolyticus TaxID=2801916 RepID=A0ABS1K075_9MICC|nr:MULTISPECIES: SMC-Scp complex subunit ScpB [Sinomonas]MBL0704919.1 SMC-Scp complex subunit ScpB [Sinomonas cellulolyticus]GHG60078.1 segregation and condensation protein B [Sinomonas sp. KCTC 49339]